MNIETLNLKVNAALDWRYATKKFDPHLKISEELWTTLKRSLQMSPSSYGLQPWRFLNVTKPELRQKLQNASYNQTPVTESSHFVVFLNRRKWDSKAISHFVESMAKQRQQPVESLAGMSDMLNKTILENMTEEQQRTWNQRQCYIAMGFLMQTAALLEIDSLPMEGLKPKEYDQILNLENSEWQTVAAVALGYRDPSDKYSTKKKVRFPLDQVVIDV